MNKETETERGLGNETDTQRGTPTGTQRQNRQWKKSRNKQQYGVW